MSASNQHATARTFGGLDDARDHDRLRTRSGFEMGAESEEDEDEVARLERLIKEADEYTKNKAKEDKKREKPDKDEGKTIKRWSELFDPRDTQAGQLFILVGKSERGKTHFLKWLLYNACLRARAPFQYGLIFVRTKFKHSYKFHWSSAKYVKIYEGFMLTVLQTFVRNLEQRHKEQGYLEPSFIIFDDLVGVINNGNPWFQNFIGTYRHFNITLFVAVQYLTGRQAVSPIMREQTTAAIMFNSKTLRTNQNLFENFGQLFPKRKEFEDHFFSMTDERVMGTRHAACVYFEWEDDIRKNYFSWLAPAELPDHQIVLKGPDGPKEEAGLEDIYKRKEVYPMGAPVHTKEQRMAANLKRAMTGQRELPSHKEINAFVNRQFDMAQLGEEFGENRRLEQPRAIPARPTWTGDDAATIDMRDESPDVPRRPASGAGPRARMDFIEAAKAWELRTGRQHRQLVKADFEFYADKLLRGREKPVPQWAERPLKRGEYQVLQPPGGGLPDRVVLAGKQRDEYMEPNRIVNTGKRGFLADFVPRALFF